MATSALVDRLQLAPHPEGGWYRETWTAPHTFHPHGYSGPRAAATAIYFLLHPGEVSRWHTVTSDELWLWHRGGPLTLKFGGTGDQPVPAVEAVLGPDVERGQRPQQLVPGRTWQSAVPLSDEPVLVSCIVAPGFDFDDFRMV
ncbi:MAG TPA: cupin domain-containing protein [Candidatus Stackebrandtia excrementipullorum]|nr:cupin domain-containing protein [Candidatus Stackebrandtia excrementipullorum]